MHSEPQSVQSKSRSSLCLFILHTLHHDLHKTKFSNGRTASQNDKSNSRSSCPFQNSPLIIGLTRSGTLITCDPSIHAIILSIDDKFKNEFIIQNLDEQHLLVKTEKLKELRQLMEMVGYRTPYIW